MKKYLKCRVCGFIGTSEEIKKVCPACGAPLSSFVGYEHQIGSKRLKILQLQLHPILVHIPQSLAMLSLVIIGLAYLIEGKVAQNLVTAEKILLIILPVSVVIAMAAGLLDAKTRFPKKFGPRIFEKMIFGSALLVSSILTAVLFNLEVFSTLGRIAIIVLNLINLACSAILGQKGASLVNSQINDKV